ncbi:MAG: PH domain-containing protein [Bdellovibrionota bacterium]
MAEHPPEQGSDDRAPREPINLRRVYPLAWRSIIRRSLHWIIAFIILLIVITAADKIRPATGSMAEQVFFMLATTLLGVGFVLLLGKLIYELISFKVCYYGIELEHFVISRGVFFKTRASFPLARLADVYVERTPIDLVFFLHNVRVTTPSPVADHGTVDGLSTKNATGLQNYLLALVNTTTPTIDERKAEDTLRTLNATEDPSILGPSPAVQDPPRMRPQDIPSNHPPRPAPPREEDQRAPNKERVAPLGRAPKQSKDQRTSEEAPPPKSTSGARRGAQRWKQRQEAIRDMSSRFIQKQKERARQRMPKRWSRRREALNTRVQQNAPEVVLNELERAQDEIERSRRELDRAELVLEKAKEIIEQSH